ncbi:MAG: cytochrome c maturation protein CcmE [Candidatus Dormibacteraeota bacterium]|uniref:Cytochrome c maturation protein CcmE n=1 Tax=Candidatus Dormiibacter inghamiae TaxID=3127013 RepID=A0A934KFF4_9BACT|nr:cytochrome c maturation protein CcmE [Candidatus Dormibacteraeota bacterium]MBJ7607005.1 cytochrome c maturation protein CcmE [Candidatus Dormibacteraeota bacterium]
MSVSVRATALLGRWRWLLLGLTVVGLLGYLIYSATGTSAEYYETINEMKAHPSDREARVLGVVQDDVVRSDGGLHIRFTAAEGSSTIPVDYTGTVPDIFRPGIQVVVAGKVGSDGVFHARTLQTKCPSRFSTASPSG